MLRGLVLPLSIPWLVHGMTPNAFVVHTTIPFCESRKHVFYMVILSIKVAFSRFPLLRE
ncbi:hypothetical protein [Rickettsia asembonensis]|uniref:hypothetical protein n=1 Tax=Rickettsia asembonensis TaxID=1068590 RepID=UPI00130DE24A|nr:hypothetical protein [Rickettsia asembonensis]